MEIVKWQNSCLYSIYFILNENYLDFNTYIGIIGYILALYIDTIKSDKRFYITGQLYGYHGI